MTFKVMVQTTAVNIQTAQSLANDLCVSDSAEFSMTEVRLSSAAVGHVLEMSASSGVIA